MSKKSKNSNRDKQKGKSQGSTQPKKADLCEAPYHFVPVRSDLSVSGEPVFHDVQQAGDDYWSGELHCTLTALTPLIAANYQFEYNVLREDLDETYKQLLNARGISEEVAGDKKIIEPVSNASSNNGLPKQILIAGEALKGMVRNSLQALLSAPMERVQERTFSFRPNLKDALNMRPAIVHSCKSEGKNITHMEVAFAGKCDDILYIKRNAHQTLSQWLAKNGYPEGKSNLHKLPVKAPRADINAEVTNLNIDKRRKFAKKLERARSSGDSADLSTYVLVRYLGGLDGKATFASAFQGRDAIAYQWALVPIEDEEPTLTPIPEDVLANYSDTLLHIEDDELGHLLTHPLKKQLPDPNRIRCQRLQPGDLIYVEEVNGKIVGIGHHFRHRRRYRDTIHTHKGRLRDQLCPAPLEKPRDEEQSPQQLTAARCIFGYVALEGNKYSSLPPNETLTFGIGKGDFNQLAGRISINWAVEQRDPARQERFLNEQYDCLVPLRPLGAPKASSVETYLTQDRLDERTDLGTLCTYGDTFDDSSAGDLHGRKFYLHQAEAADNPKCYELVDKNQPDWKSGETHNLISNQAGIARFVSTAGTTFRFAVRFRDLRSWELGALLFTLSPDQNSVEKLLEKLTLKKAPEKIQNWLNRIQQWKPDANNPLLALKLGHGRPLGLGSVKVAVDAIKRLQFNEENMLSLDPLDAKSVQVNLVEKLAEKISQDRSAEEIADWAEAVLLPWLQVHRYAGRQSFDYPRGKDDLIYDFHTKERQKHSEGRKRSKDKQTVQSGGLKSLDQLDREGK